MMPNNIIDTNVFFIFMDTIVLRDAANKKVKHVSDLSYKTKRAIEKNSSYKTQIFDNKYLNYNNDYFISKGLIYRIFIQQRIFSGTSSNGKEYTLTTYRIVVENIITGVKYTNEGLEKYSLKKAMKKFYKLINSTFTKY